MMQDRVSREKLDSYFKITGEALDVAKKAWEPSSEKLAQEFWDMAQRYYSDAKFFEQKGDFVLALAALSYAHGWLDAGAHAKLFRVKDSRLFTVDDGEQQGV